LNPGITKRFERTAALIDVSDDDAYVLDIFRVAGGADHVKFYTTHFGALSPLGGLALQDVTDFAHPQMRNFKVARKPEPGWSVEVKVEDRYKLLPPDAKDVRVRFTDFTTGVDGYTCEGWVVAGSYNSTAEAWVPRVMTRRPGGESTFVTVVEPFSGEKPLITKSRRVSMATDSLVALVLDLADGRSDVLVSNDTGAPMTLADVEMTTDAKLVLVRRDAQQRPTMISLCGGQKLQIGKVNVSLPQVTEFAQFRVAADGAVTRVEPPRGSN